MLIVETACGFTVGIEYGTSTYLKVEAFEDTLIY